MEVNNRLMFAVMTDYKIPEELFPEMEDVFLEVSRSYFHNEIAVTEIAPNSKFYVAERYNKSMTTEAIGLYQKLIYEQKYDVSEFADYIGVKPPIHKSIILTPWRQFAEKYNVRLIDVTYQLVKIPVLPYEHQHYGTTFPELNLIFPYKWGELKRGNDETESIRKINVSYNEESEV